MDNHLPPDLAIHGFAKNPKKPVSSTDGLSPQLGLFDRKPVQPAKPQSSPQRDPDDITQNFHGGNEFSRRANLRAARRKESLRIRIYAAFVAAGPKGDIAESIYRALGIGDNTGTARVSELKRDGQLLRTIRETKTSTGSAAQVLVANVFRSQNADQIVPYQSRKKA